jgi:hypothetical protein
MTSGVKQALPQILTPKAGIDGKAAHNRAPRADFAETLGMGNDAKPDLPEADARPSWPRLASKLDEAIDRTQEIAPKFEAEVDVSKDADKDDLPDIRPETRNEVNTPKDVASSNVARNVADIPSTPASTPASPAHAKDADARAGASAFSPEGPVAHAARDIVLAKPVSTPAPESSSEKSFVPMGRGDQAEAIRFEAAARAAASSERSSLNKPKDALPEVSTEPAKTAPRITVLAQQNIPAPTPSTALVLVESIAASDVLHPAGTRFSLDAIHASATHASAQSLKIQLHPAELGMVTATLRFQGEQLSIELRVENHEAYRRLASDSETIIGSLRDLGYDVERVTILQPQIAALPPARSDASASMPSPQGRSAEQFGSGTANGGSGGSGEHAPGNGGNQGNSAQHRSSTRDENSGSGLFI